MDTRIWGPHAWEFMHAITFAYPDEPSYEQQESAKEFFYSLEYLLPCPICKYHYSQVIKQKPPNVESSSELIIWLFEIHNLVNLNTNKKEIKFEEFIKIYNTKYTNNKGNLSNIYIIITFILLICIFVLFFNISKCTQNKNNIKI